MYRSDRLKDKVVVVTGSTQGLGEGISECLAMNGVKGLLLCGRNEARGAKVQAKLAKLDCPAHFVQADLSQEEDCRRVIRECVEHFGTLHGLVNAAGITTRGTLESTSVKLWDEMFAINTRAPFILTQEATNQMKLKAVKGSVVNILSMSAHGGQPFITAYCASKGALQNFCKNAAHSLRFDRIRVNGINMGWCLTENEIAVQKQMGKPEDWLVRAEREQPFKRILRPRDVGMLCTYLLSDESEMMTGSILDLDQNVMGCYD